jgi:mono/diheme cytochrome c family protein/glucose/arabinose dehydrogenase
LERLTIIFSIRPSSGSGIPWITGIALAFLFSGCSESKQAVEGPSPEKSPSEELATFQLAAGLQIQLVACEPMVQDPVVIQFDPAGRLWVVEMRGFMPDIDGKGENERVGRISILEDTDLDGTMDTSWVYIDSLIMPRALALVPGGALIAENLSLWLTEDVDGDLKADTKTLLDSAYAGNASPEHSGNGLWRNVDNWYYNAKSRLRYKLAEGKWIRDSTEFRGQWGISHDDKGRLVYNYNWSQLHADLVPPNYLSRNKNHTPTTGIDHGLTIDRRVYPIRPNPAVNRGYIPGTLSKDGKLQEFTAACSPYVYRGTALPDEYYGNVFVCEPSGNLVKRNVVTENGAILKAYDPNPGTEFLASTDERFRPVFLTSGPDGALYIADMYRGLVQHGLYVTPYLREQTLKRKLVLPINRGRIWRIVPAHWKPVNQLELSQASTQELISALSSKNGWHRDIAQRLLVERQDRSIKSTLEEVVKNDKNPLGRFHALWTMEGLQLLNADLLFSLVNDSNPLVSSTAVRLLEPLVRKDAGLQARFKKRLQEVVPRAPVEQVLQISLSTEVLKPNNRNLLLVQIAERYDTSALIRDCMISSLQDQEFNFIKAQWNSPSWKNPAPGKEIFLEMLTTAVVKNRKPAELSALFSLLDGTTSSQDWKAKTVLASISIQGKTKMRPVRLETAPAILAKNEGDAELETLINMFEWPGHVVDTSHITTTIDLNENEQKQFVEGRQLYLTACAGCHGSDGAGVTRFAPPLVDSDWVLGDEKRLTLVLLHGIEGPIEVNGKRYDVPDILPVMPSLSTMDDNSIASILTYIRNAWNNRGGAVSRRTVGMTRITSQGRVIPWTSEELNKHIVEIKENENDKAQTQKK